MHEVTGPAGQFRRMMSLTFVFMETLFVFWCEGGVSHLLAKSHMACGSIPEDDVPQICFPLGLQKPPDRLLRGLLSGCPTQNWLGAIRSAYKQNNQKHTHTIPYEPRSIYMINMVSSVRFFPFVAAWDPVELARACPQGLRGGWGTVAPVNLYYYY